VRAAAWKWQATVFTHYVNLCRHLVRLFFILAAANTGGREITENNGKGAEKKPLFRHVTATFFCNC
ncbi:hypothetical protein, partial [Aeromonas dhakensis]|uniref:hypothetical protein n=1 Tax=Aeromonas dhakensis TaxID=196024 RepID=UPI0039A25C8E